MKSYKVAHHSFMFFIMEKLDLMRISEGYLDPDSGGSLFGRLRSIRRAELARNGTSVADENGQSMIEELKKVKERFFVRMAEISGIVPDTMESAQEEMRRKLWIIHLNTLMKAIEKNQEESEDFLTKLYTREQLDKDGTEEIEQHRRAGVSEGEIMKPLSVIMIDVDHFSDINNTYGHQAGDEVLRLLAAILKKHVRISDKIYRYAGDEFTVLLPFTTSRDAMVAAEKLRTAVESEVIEIPDKAKVPIKIRLTLSAGVADSNSLSFLDGIWSEIETNAREHGQKKVLQEVLERILLPLIHHADTALLEAKDNGKNRPVAFSHKFLKRAPKSVTHPIESLPPGIVIGDEK